MPDDRKSRTTGFSLVEVVVALLLTTIVMGAVFALLTQGLATPERESQRADVQAQARSALDLLTADILNAGANLPPEFPSFTSGLVIFDSALNSGRAIEIVGARGAEDAIDDRVRVASFADDEAHFDALPANIGVGDLVVVYDDAPVNGKWVFGVVAEVRPDRNALTLRTRPGAGGSDGIALPQNIERYNRSTPEGGYMTRVQVVRYSVGIDTLRSGDREAVLMRQVNWGTPVPTADLEDLQVRFVVGATTSRPPERAYEPPPKEGEPGTMPTGEELAPPPPSGPVIERRAPHPQPDPAVPVNPGRVIQGIQIAVTARSRTANLMGSRVRPGQSADDPGYLRLTLSSRVTPRNLLYRLSARETQPSFN